RAIYSEREFNFFPYYFNDPPVPYEHQLKYLTGCFKVFEQWLENTRVDFIVSELITGSADAVLKAVAEKKGVNYFSVRPSKMTTGIVVCDKFYDEPMDLAENYERFIKSGIPDGIRSAALKHLEGIRGKIQHPAYMEATKKPHKLLSISKINILLSRLFRHKVPVNSISARRYPLKNSIRWAIHKKINVWLTQWSHTKLFAKNVSDGEQYFIYPLHYEPESSTLVRAFYFSDQLALIKTIAKVLPLGVKLVVKEHGGNQGYRKPGFYKEVSYLPNVILIPPQFEVSKLVKNCIGVITLTGRMGWEALVNKKPVITLGHTFWTSFPTVHYVVSWRELSEAVIRCCQQHDSKPDDEQLVAFAAAYIQCTHEGAFVLNTKNYLSVDNISKFSKIMLGLCRQPLRQ
ncbi:MAG TPA: hypothetical protein PLN99_13560, partial [Daejeonella sp.]|nr:hypothetical protein [Daejeonella sp.]